MARQKIMLCYPFEEKRLKKWIPPYLVQPKLDGERCRSEYDPSANCRILLSSEQNSFNLAVPHIVRAITKQVPKHFETDGELYIHNSSFEEIHSICSRKTNLHPDYSSIEYHIFDLVTPDPQYARVKQLHNIELKPPLFLVPSYIASNLEEIMKIYDNLTDSGYEGVVIRHIDNMYVFKRSTFVMKFKPKKSDDYTIVGYKEELSIEGKPKNRLGSLICSGNDGSIFSVGSGLTDEDRVSLWDSRDSLVGKVCHVKYQHITPGRGVPRFPVFIEVKEPFIHPLLKEGNYEEENVW